MVLLDTGSTNVLLISSLCNSDICANHNKYDVDWQKENWEKAPQKSVNYISGKNEGKIILENINIGDVDIKD